MPRNASPYRFVLSLFVLICITLGLTPGVTSAETFFLSPALTLRWNADGTLLALSIGEPGSMGSRHQIEIQDPETGDIINIISTANVRSSIAWHPIEPDVMAITAYDQYPGARTQIIHALDGTVETEFLSAETTPPYINVLAWSPDGTRLAIGNGEGYMEGAYAGIEIRDRAGEMVAWASWPARITSDIAWSPDGTLLAVEVFEQATTVVYILDAATAETIARIAAEPQVDPIGGATLTDPRYLGAWDPTGAQLLLFDVFDVLLYDAKTFTLTERARTPYSPSGADWSAVNDLVLLETGRGQLMLLDPKDPVMQAELGPGRESSFPLTADWHPVSGQLAFYDGDIQLPNLPQLSRYGPRTTRLSPDAASYDAEDLRELFNFNCVVMLCFGYAEVNVATREDVLSIPYAVDITLNYTDGSSADTTEITWYQAYPDLYLDGSRRGQNTFTFTDDIVSQITGAIDVPLDTFTIAFGAPEVVWPAPESSGVDYLLAYPSLNMAVSLIATESGEWRTQRIYLVDSAEATNMLNLPDTDIIIDPCTIFIDAAFCAD